MKVLFLIAARGGSKTIPGKNLVQIGGISLVGYKAISARRSRYCSRLIISTDSPEIQADARRYGVEAPFTRPAELAADDSASEDVVAHAMDFIERHGTERYDAVMLLEPTTPFATHVDYDRAVETMVERQANVVVGVRRAAINSIFQGSMDERGGIGSIVDKLIGVSSVRRQDVVPEYTMNGALYLLRWDFFKRHRRRYCDPANTYGLLMDPAYSVEIDEPIDLAFAQFLVESGHVDLSFWTEASVVR